MQPRVHCLVEYGCRNLSIREGWIHSERKLDKARVLLMKVRAAAGKSLDDNACEVLLEMAIVVGHVVLDESKRAVKARQHFVSIDIRARVVHKYGNSAHGTLGDLRGLTRPPKQL